MVGGIDFPARMPSNERLCPRPMFVMLAFWIILTLYILTCGLLVVVILSQEGSKGGGLSGGLGMTAGETFGFSSATETFRRFTRILATVFVVLSIILTYLGNRMVSRGAAHFTGAAVEAPAPAAPAVTPGAVPNAATGTPAAVATPAAAAAVTPAASPAAAPVSSATPAPAAATPAAADGSTTAQ
jgi:protein translocase SecG subunit